MTPRARDLGIPLGGAPGPLNAITDVAGVEVGFTTLVADTPHIVRTGVTAILPRPRADLFSPVWAGQFNMNGNGEMTGAHWINEAGWFTGPITITNTFSIGRAHHATVQWMAEHFAQLEQGEQFILPVAAETFDGWLNDIARFAVTEADVIAAIDAARPGPVAEGNVGGGTGMTAYEFKAGTGTASRIVRIDGADFTVGALVQANHGLRPWLTIAGVPVGQLMPEGRFRRVEQGSIIGIVATDAPLLPSQLQRLARRAALGMGRAGTPSGNSSGDLFLAFSTANSTGRAPEPSRYNLDCLGNDTLDPLFLAVVEAIDEAVLNALVAAETMTGRNGRTVLAIDHERLRKLFAR